MPELQGTVAREQRRDPEAPLLAARLVSEGPAPLRPSMDAAWRVLPGLGLLLAVVGVVDVALYAYPPAFGSPEWEFGTVASMVSSLPLPTIGFAALLAWALARGGRAGRSVVGITLLAAALLVAAAYVLFLLNVPLALRSANGPQGTLLVRAIIRTSVMAVGFGLGYLVSGIVLIRTLFPRKGP